MADQLEAAHGTVQRERKRRTHEPCKCNACTDRHRRKRSTAARRTTHATSQLQGARRQRRNQSLPHRSSSRLRADYSFPLFLACTDSAMHAWSVPHRFADCQQSVFVPRHALGLPFSAEPAFSLNLSASSISRRRSSSSLLHACPVAWKPSAGRLVATTSSQSRRSVYTSIIIMHVVVECFSMG